MQKNRKHKRIFPSEQRPGRSGRSENNHRMKKKKTEKSKAATDEKNKTKARRSRRGKAGKGEAPAPTGSAPAGNIEQWRKDFALGRRQETREKQRQAEAQERLQVFIRRTREASGKKAQKTARTRGYYRFSKTYPSNVDAEGFREPPPSPGGKKRIWLCVLCGLLAFCLSFVVTKTSLLISKETPENAVQDEDLTPPAAKLRMLRFSYEDYAAGNAAAVVETLNANGCNAALFEIKSPSGYVNLAMPEFAAAGKREVDPSAMLEQIKAAGCETAAYISCFLDPLAARWEVSMAVRRTNDQGDVWTDNAGFAWLNPFSQAARTYVSQIASSAAKAGFDYIVLDNVCFSSDSGTAMPYYPGEDGAGVSRNAVLNAFVEDIVTSASGARVIVMCRFSAFDPLADADLPAYGGNLLQTAASALCVDARLSFQQKNVAIGTERFSDPASLPFVFTLAAGDYAVQGITDALSGAESMICIENGDTLADTLRAVKLMNLYGYVIW